MFGTTAFPTGIFASVSDLAERVQWILNNRHRPDGKLWKAKPLSKEAGLGETHVGMIARHLLAPYAHSETDVRTLAAQFSGFQKKEHGQR